VREIVPGVEEGLVSASGGPLERAIRAIPGWLSRKPGDCRCPTCGTYHPPNVTPPEEVNP